MPRLTITTYDNRDVAIDRTDDYFPYEEIADEYREAVDDVRARRRGNIELVSVYVSPDKSWRRTAFNFNDHSSLTIVASN